MAYWLADNSVGVGCPIENAVERYERESNGRVTKGKKLVPPSRERESGLRKVEFRSKTAANSFLTSFLFRSRRDHRTRVVNAVNVELFEEQR